MKKIGTSTFFELTVAIPRRFVEEFACCFCLRSVRSYLVLPGTRLGCLLGTKVQPANWMYHEHQLGSFQLPQLTCSLETKQNSPKKIPGNSCLSRGGNRKLTLLIDLNPMLQSTGSPNFIEHERWPLFNARILQISNTNLSSWNVALINNQQSSYVSTTHIKDISMDKVVQHVWFCNDSEKGSRWWLW